MKGMRARQTAPESIVHREYTRIHTCTSVHISATPRHSPRITYLFAHTITPLSYIAGPNIGDRRAYKALAYHPTESSSEGFTNWAPRRYPRDEPLRRAEYRSRPTTAQSTISPVLAIAPRGRPSSSSSAHLTRLSPAGQRLPHSARGARSYSTNTLSHPAAIARPLTSRSAQTSRSPQPHPRQSPASAGYSYHPHKSDSSDNPVEGYEGRESGDLRSEGGDASSRSIFRAKGSPRRVVSVQRPNTTERPRVRPPHCS
jgi:hypothetical protein